MIVKIKTFSGESLYLPEEDYLDEVLFSSKKNKKKRPKYDLEDVNSPRGYGRSILLGGLIPGAVGTYVGSKEATKAAKEGKKSGEIKDRATKRGAIAGAAIGGGLGLLGTRNIGRSAGLAAYGALGGGLGARKNASDRIRKANERRYDD